MGFIAFRKFILAPLLIIALCNASLRAEDGFRPEVTTAVPRVGMAAVDAALDADGVLRGRVVDGNGQPVPMQQIELYHNQRVVNRMITDSNGRFELCDLRGGIYALACGKHVGTYRVWAPRTAPPHAQQQLVLYCGDVVRGQACSPDGPCGQDGCGTCGGRPKHSGQFIGGFSLPSIHPVQFLKNPWTIGAAIGAAVAIPIALHDDEAAS